MTPTYKGKTEDVAFGRSLRPELRVLDTVRDDDGNLTIYWEDGSSQSFHAESKTKKANPKKG